MLEASGVDAQEVLIGESSLIGIECAVVILVGGRRVIPK
jgi:hypothetical protein